MRNFDTGCDDCGNEIWWNGGAGSGKIGASGWFGSYLTAYDTGLNGGYGIFTGNEENGTWENIYASGFNDSGMYIGACRECNARVSKAVMENNALGYSGSNSSGQLVIEKSTFNNNLTGIAPNSENPSDPPPPLDGACDSFKNTSPTPTFDSTKIKRCEIFRNNRVENNNNTTVPINGSTEIAPWGVGIELPGTYAVQTENNVITGNPNNGVLGFEYPNPFPPEEATIFFQLSGNKINNNILKNNGYNPGLEGSPLKAFNGDVALLSNFAELFGGPESRSVNNCLSGNSFADATFPTNIEGTWGCQNKTTPNPGGGEAAAEYILTLQGQIEFIRSLTPAGAPAGSGTAADHARPVRGRAEEPALPERKHRLGLEQATTTSSSRRPGRCGSAAAAGSPVRTRRTGCGCPTPGSAHPHAASVSGWLAARLGFGDPSRLAALFDHDVTGVDLDGRLDVRFLVPWEHDEPARMGSHACVLPDREVQHPTAIHADALAYEGVGGLSVAWTCILDPVVYAP